MANSLLKLGGQLLGMILIISGTVLCLHGTGESEPLIGPFLGIGEAVAGVVLFLAGVTALVLVTLRGSKPIKRTSQSSPRMHPSVTAETSAAERLAAAEETSPQASTADLEALIRWDEQEHKESSSGLPSRMNALPADAEAGPRTPKCPFGDA